MPIIRDMQYVLSKASADEHFRTLILIDKVFGNPPVFCHFSHRFDQSSSGYIRDYFQKTYDQIRDSSDMKVYNAAELPILNSVGRWKIAIITRESEDHYSIRDGEGKDFDSYAGLGS